MAFALRLATIHFGLPAINDPDELIFEGGASRMLRGLTFDPGWFGHPATTTMYLLAIIDVLACGVALLTGRVATGRAFGELMYSDPSWIVLPGRVAMAVFAVGTVWLTWRLAGRLFGRTAAIGAALLVTFDPVHITWSQIIRSDIMACFFMLLCLSSALDIARAGRSRDYWRAALWAGLAIATKWPFAISWLAVGGASLVAVRAGHLSVGVAIRRVVWSGIATVGFLLAASPYLVIDFPTVVANLQGESHTHHLGATGGGVGANVLWYIDGPLLTGFGIVGLILLVLGLGRFVRHLEASAIIGPVALAFLAVLSVQHLVWDRWALPLLLLGAMVAGAGLAALAAWLRQRMSHRLTGGLTVAVLAAAVSPLGAEALGDSRARMHNTAQLASAWARQHVPAGSTVLVEHFAFDLVGEPWRLLFPVGDAGCIDVTAMQQGRISYAAIERAKGSRSNVDYGTSAAARRATCRADFAILTQYNRYRDERAAFPDEYAAYRDLIATGRVVAVLTPVAGHSAGRVVTIIDFRRGPPSSG